MPAETSKRSNFLIISPYPADTSYGGGLRLAGIIEALEPHGEIDLVVTNTPEPYPQNAYVRKTVSINLRETGFFERVCSLINKATPFFIFGTARLRNQVNLMCRETNYRLIICRYPRTLERLGRINHTKVLLDVDDNEYERKIQERNATKGFLAKAYLSTRALLSLYLFKKVINAADYLWLVKADNTIRPRTSNTWLVPNVAFSINAVPDATFVESNRLANTIVFIGHLGYPPNRDGIEWFVRQVWPLIQIQEPTLRLDVVGKCKHAPTIRLIESTSNARLRGFIPLLSDVYRNALLCINPCTSGSGTHIKIIEAMLNGRIVITTFFGVRGWEEASKECGCPIIAANAQEFAAQCIRCYRERAVTLSLQQKALAYAGEKGTLAYFKKTVAAFMREEKILLN